MNSTFQHNKRRGEALVPESVSIAPAGVNFTQMGSGSPVIMAHGLAASLHDWDELLPVLAEHSYAGYALDLFGHGDSAKPDDLSLYTIDNVFNHMQGWLDSLELKEPMFLIGHSLGGCLALQYVLRFPEKVKALVLVNPFYSIQQLPAALQLFFRQKLVNTSLIERTPYWLFRALIDLSSLTFGAPSSARYTLPEAVRIQTALDYKRSSPNIYNIPRTLQNLTCNLSTIALPTLVIWGANDQTLAPESFPKLVELLPNARGVAFPAGHVPHQSHVQEFNHKILEFFEQVG